MAIKDLRVERHSAIIGDVNVKGKVPRSALDAVNLRQFAGRNRIHVNKVFKPPDFSLLLAGVLQRRSGLLQVCGSSL